MTSSTLGHKEVKSQTEVLFPFEAEQLKLVLFENVEQCEKLLLQLLLLDKQAFDSIAGNTVVPYRSLKKFFIYHKFLFIVIYNSTLR